jgi:AMMECR1 domain-containing protein
MRDIQPVLVTTGFSDPRYDHRNAGELDNIRISANVLDEWSGVLQLKDVQWPVTVNKEISCYERKPKTKPLDNN